MQRSKDILKQLTSERVKEEIEAIQKIKLPTELKKWVREYKKVGDRNDFFWKWSLWAIRKTSFFPLGAEDYLDSLEKARFLLNMYVILVDEISERKKEDELFDKLLLIPFEKHLERHLEKHQNLSKFIYLNDLGNRRKNILRIARKIWCEIEKEVKKYPRYNQMEDAFWFGIAQVLNALYYDHIIIKNPSLINIPGSWIYSSHSTQVVMTFILNSMCSKGNPTQEFNLLMKIAFEAQKMMRIGNWIATWKREVLKNDFTSGIFSYAVDSKIINPKEITVHNKINIVKKITQSNVEDSLLKEWDRSYTKLNKLSKAVRNINLKRFSKVLEDFLRVDLANRKLLENKNRVKYNNY